MGWDPVIEPGIVLRPHVMKWSPPQSQSANLSQKPGDHFEADPLHDPGADEDDEKWVTHQLLQPDSADQRTTAAVLNCPGCFTPICYQCQQHEQYSRQWRAIEVRNCAVDRSASLSLGADDPAKYFGVRCATCSAEVGLLDDSEVYHLFHVLESSA